VANNEAVMTDLAETNLDFAFGLPGAETLDTGRPSDAATGLQDNLNRWYDASVGKWLSQDPIGFGGGDANLYGYCDNAPTEATDPSGMADWDPTAVKGLLNKTEAGKAVSPGLQSSIVMQSPKVEAYYQERAKATDPWPNSWTPYEWGDMTTKKAITKTTIQSTLHIPASLDTYEAARFLVHEGTHAMGGGEPEAYTAETNFAIQLLKVNPNDQSARALLRPGMYKDGKNGLEVDPQGISAFLKSPEKSNYPAWEGEAPLKRFQKDAQGNNRVEYGTEKQVKF
jgi:RHS repeat-associated protein